MNENGWHQSDRYGIRIYSTISISRCGASSKCNTQPKPISESVYSVGSVQCDVPLNFIITCFMYSAYTGIFKEYNS